LAHWLSKETTAVSDRNCRPYGIHQLFRHNPCSRNGCKKPGLRHARRQ
jgi:hypothetical protein